MSNFLDNAIIVKYGLHMTSRFPMTTMAGEGGDLDALMLERALDEPISSLGMSVRTTNFLEGKGILEIRELLQTTKSELLAIPDFANASLNEVLKATIQYLRRHGHTKYEPLLETLKD